MSNSFAVNAHKRSHWQVQSKAHQYLQKSISPQVQRAPALANLVYNFVLVISKGTM